MSNADSQWAAYAKWSGNDTRFRRLLDVLPAAAYTCDAAGLITYYNQHAVNLWGRQPALNDQVDRFCGSLKLYSADGTPICHDECWMALAMRENKEYNGCEIIVERPDGGRRTALAHANPFRDEAGQPNGAVNILVDITDRKLAEVALREADHRKDEFLAILAHELRNPLAPIRSALELMRASSDNEAAHEQFREMMERQVQQIVRLVDDLMDVARISNNKFVLRKARVNLADVLQSALEAARPLIAKCGHEVIVSSPHAMYLHGDQGRLVQVFSNLLNNAAKYMEPGGRIWLSAQQDGSTAVVTVRDAGFGIAADVMPRIFDLFNQVERTPEQSRGGLGIGLNLARAQVEMHNGSIEVHSDGVGQGSTFVVRLPLSLGTDVEVAKAVSKGPESGTLAKRILIVDDNKDAVTGLSLLLQHSGNAVHVAYDGLEALRAAEEFAPDVVLLDIDLPILDGYAVARKLREHPWGRSIHLIAVTGWGHAEHKRRAMAAGFDLHMVKPLDLAALEKHLSTI